MNKVPVANLFDLALIDQDAVKVIRRLRSHDYEAYLVGGSVRDLLLGRTPKDFDIATSASPRQIKKVFVNSRLIGRRFRLAHVFFGQKILEVSTFRSNVIASQPDDTVGDEGEERDLLIRDDNIFGTAEEDAIRRDFTINGLFFDPETAHVLDYVNGLPDLEAKQIRTIGDPEIRLREDPVRILRAIKFAARLGFEIEPATREAMLRHRDEILRCSPARVYEEIMRLLASGAAKASVKIMWDTGVLDILLPDLTAYLKRSGGADGDLLWRALDALDKLVQAKRPLTGAIIVGVAFLPLLEERLESPEFSGFDYGLRVDRVVDSVTRNLRLPKRENALLKQVLIARRRLRPDTNPRRRKAGIQRMAGKAYFGATVVFYEVEMRCQGATDETIVAWEADLGAPIGDTSAHHGEGDGAPRRKRRRRRRRGEAPTGTPAPF